MKKIVKSEHWNEVPDLSQRPLPAPPTYEANLTYTMWTPAYVKVKGGYVPMMSVATEYDEEVEFLSVGELRKAIESLPDDAAVQLYDSEADDFFDAQSLVADDEVLKLR